MWHKYDLHGRIVQQQQQQQQQRPLVSRRKSEDRVLFAEEHLDKDKKMERPNLVR